MCTVRCDPSDSSLPGHKDEEGHGLAGWTRVRHTRES